MAGKAFCSGKPRELLPAFLFSNFFSLSLSFSFLFSLFFFIKLSFHLLIFSYFFQTFTLFIFLYLFISFLLLNCCLSLSLLGYVRCFSNCLHLSTSRNFFFLSFCFIFLSLSCKMALTVARTVSAACTLMFSCNRTRTSEKKIRL